MLQQWLQEPGQTVLVAGATGGVGQLLAAKLLERGFTVKALSRDPEKSASILGKAPGLQVAYGDTRDTESLPAAVEGVDAVVCCTGTTAFPSKRWDGGNTPENTDYVGVRNLVDATPRSIHRFVLISSVGVDRAGSFPFIILNAFGVRHVVVVGYKPLKFLAFIVLFPLFLFIHYSLFGRVGCNDKKHVSSGCCRLVAMHKRSSTP